MRIIIGLLFLTFPVFAGEWALLDEKNVVKTVIVADDAYIQKQTDGPWVRVYKKTGPKQVYFDNQFFESTATVLTYKLSGLTTSYVVVKSTASTITSIK